MFVIMDTNVIIVSEEDEHGEHTSNTDWWSEQALKVRTGRLVVTFHKLQKPLISPVIKWFDLSELPINFTTDISWLCPRNTVYGGGGVFLSLILHSKQKNKNDKKKMDFFVEGMCGMTVVYVCWMI